jgi:hypothetical protein
VNRRFKAITDGVYALYGGVTVFRMGLSLLN